MTLPTITQIYETVEATWPPVATTSLGPWTLRDGGGGGKRVSAATLSGPFEPGSIALAEDAMVKNGQVPLFMIRMGDQALDSALAKRGYSLIDPVTAYAGPVSGLTDRTPRRMDGFTAWPPLAIMNEIWDPGGIGPARRAVMQRADCVKTTILGRAGDRSAGVAYVAIHRRIAMLHALEVAPEFRRQGVASNILRLAAHWAQDHGATTFSLVTTSENVPSNALYASLGLRDVGKYHYMVGEHTTGS